MLLMIPTAVVRMGTGVPQKIRQHDILKTIERLQKLPKHLLPGKAPVWSGNG